ncbi:MAG: 16S rRNA (adenine(1518)-N(6)/adenine(1519)-N(6))-dimethyltransferase RsmA [Clostridiales bacterium]|nr:16S rRNA (adenine(1518)-N(6)/adenine(1519)-N(6))-dimethyltransferase RsmA [Clostridiales bacterium]
MDNILNILRQKNFVTKKKFGQNFITDANLLSAIADDSGITKGDVVVEIGPGAGTLTRALAQKADFVYAFEIDETLEPVLGETVGDLDNVKVIFKDILKVKPDELMGVVSKPFKVVANLPYYITSPVLFYFLENEFPLLSLTVMVQREVALRMIAEHNTPDYGVLSLAVQSRANAEITRYVSRKLFHPEPNVDSAVVKLTLNDGIPNRAVFDKLVRCAFACRRKTLVNNLMQSMGISREAAEELLSKAGLDVKIRGEALSKEQFLTLSEFLK